MFSGEPSFLAGAAASVIGALAFFVIAYSLWPQSLPRTYLEQLSVTGEKTPGVLERLKRRLLEAGLTISVTEFLLTVLAVGAGAGLLVYALMGAILPAGMVALSSLGLYGFFLMSRADTRRQEKEEQLPQLVSTLITSARIGNDLQRTAYLVAERGPVVFRDDWAYIAAQLRLGGRQQLDEIFAEVVRRHNSLLIGSLYEMLLDLTQQRAPLTEMLPHLQTTLQDRTRTLKEVRAKMNRPLIQLWIMAAMPFAYVLGANVIFPEISSFYRTWFGQLLVLAGWGLSGGAFVYGYRYFSAQLRREIDFMGQLDAQPRPISAGVGSVPAGASASPKEPR